MNKINILSTDENAKYSLARMKLLAFGYKPITTQKLYSCKAYVAIYSDAIILFSYDTPIAIFYPTVGCAYNQLRVVYRYTSTSNQHYAKFLKWLTQNRYNLIVSYTVR